jgi:vanillate O-demethylase ferredoxin subunit
MNSEDYRHIIARIQRRKNIAEDVVCLDLVPAAGGNFPPFTAGSHVDLYVSDSIIRQYSISNDPADPSCYRLAIYREPQSRGGSKAIHENFRVGDMVRISRPRNNFELSGNDGKVVLAAGGIGVTPVLSMAYRLAAEGRDFTLHLCARSMARAPFLEEIASGPFASRFRLHLDDGPLEQRFSAPDVFAEAGPASSVYICGPQGFMTFVTDAAKTAGISAGNVHIESFVPAAFSDENEFEVVAAQSGKTVIVKHDQSIADALEAAGITPLLSCEQGICGTCLTRVLSGEIDHRDSYQTEAEKQKNDRIAICCSRAKSRQIVLDI